MTYTLMNRKTPLCNFEITGEGDLEYCKVIENFSPLPEWISDVDSWVGNRSAAKHREHVNKLLEQCGGKTKSGFIALTHCLSLTDTLWVKSEKENVEWSQINLYENRFDETVSKFAFDGNGLFGIQMSTTSPELTTDGSYDKCWLNEKDGIHLIKAGSTGACNTGLEPYSEVLASQVYEKLCPGSVTYTLRKYDGRVVSDCKLFTSQDFGYRPVSIFLKEKASIPKLLELYAQFDSEEEFRRMVIADCVTLNSDRHFGNFGFTVNNKTFERIKMNPVFDLNMCFTPYAYDTFGFDNFDEYLRDRGPVLGSNYVSPAKALLTDAILSDLKICRDIELVVQDDDLFKKKRVEQMNMVKDVQIDKILGIERVFMF